MGRIRKTDITHLADSEKQVILAMHEERVDGRQRTYTEIAHKVGRSRHAVKRVIERVHGASPRVRRCTTGETRRIIELYQTRRGNRWLSTVEIAKIVGRSSTFVHDVVTHAGVARSHSEAATMYIPPETRYSIIILSIEFRWTKARIAQRFGVKVAMVSKVLNEADLSAWAVQETGLLLGLYQQGRSIREVARLTDRPLCMVERIVRDAGVVRERIPSQALAMRRIAASNKLARMNIRLLAARWVAGAEVEELAAEHDVPPDLLWDAVADVLCTMTPVDAFGLLHPPP